MALVPLISLPLFLRILGPSQWTQLTLFQMFGAVLGLLVDLAWSVDGHGKINQNRNLIRMVQIQKYMMFFLIIVITLPLAYYFRESVDLVSWLGMLWIASMSLSNWWHALALGTIKRFTMIELLPRIIPVLSLLLFVKSKGDICRYLITFIFLNVVFCWNRNIEVRNNLSFYQILTSIFPRLKLVLWRILQSSYYLFGLPILTVISPSNCFTYALVERVYRFSMTATLPLQDYLILRPPMGNKFFSSWKAMTLFQTLFSCMVFLLLSSPVIFSSLIGTNNPSYALTICFFLLVSFVAVNRVLVVQFTKKTFLSKNLNKPYLVSAVIFLATVFPLTYFAGSYGVVCSSVLAEMAFFMQLRRNIASQQP